MAFVLVLNCGPWRDTITYGQVNITLMAMVVTGVLFLGRTRFSGLLLLARKDLPALARMGLALLSNRRAGLAAGPGHLGALLARRAAGR